jgi:hypothetical protein
MPSTLNPAWLLCGLRYADRPLGEPHIRGDPRHGDAGDARTSQPCVFPHLTRATGFRPGTQVRTSHTWRYRTPSRDAHRTACGRKVLPDGLVRQRAGQLDGDVKAGYRSVRVRPGVSGPVCAAIVLTGPNAAARRLAGSRRRGE